MLAMVGAGAYFSLHALLERDTRQQLATYHEVVQLPAKTAHLTITLP